MTLDWVESSCTAWFDFLHQFHSCVVDQLLEACESSLSAANRDLGVCAIFILLAVLVCPLIAARYVKNVDDAADSVMRSAVKFTQKVRSDLFQYFSVGWGTLVHQWKRDMMF